MNKSVPFGPAWACGGNLSLRCALLRTHVRITRKHGTSIDHTSPPARPLRHRFYALHFMVAFIEVWLDDMRCSGQPNRSSIGALGLNVTPHSCDAARHDPTRPPIIFISDLGSKGRGVSLATCCGDDGLDALALARESPRGGPPTTRSLWTQQGEAPLL